MSLLLVSQLIGLLMFALSEEGPPCVDKTDCVSPGGRQVGIWNMLATCNIVFAASREMLSCSVVKGPKRVLFPFSQLHQMMQMCLLRFCQIGEKKIKHSITVCTINMQLFERKLCTICYLKKKLTRK